MIAPATSPPLGWNSFIAYGTVTDEKALYENLDVFVEKLKPAGYRYFVLDIGWYGEFGFTNGICYPESLHAPDTSVDRYGRYTPSRYLFPGGLRPVIKRVHDAGLLFGIHVMRGIPRKAVELNLPIKGTCFTARDIADISSRCEWCHYNYGIDMKKPGAFEYYRSFIDLLASWGVDMIKADDIVPYPDEIDGIVSAIQKQSRTMLLSLSPGDIVNPDNMDRFRQTNMLRVTSDIWDKQKDIDKGFEAWKRFGGMGRPGFWIDLDMIPFGKLLVTKAKPKRAASAENAVKGVGYTRMSRFTGAQKRTFITQRALAASPIFMGGYLPATDSYSFSLLTNTDMLECSKNGIMGQLVHENEGIEMWKAGQKDNPHCGWIGVFNRTEGRQHLTLTADDFGLSPEKQYRYRDIWHKRPFKTGELSLSIPANDVIYLRYSGDSREP